MTQEESSSHALYAARETLKRNMEEFFTERDSTSDKIISPNDNYEAGVRLIFSPPMRYGLPKELDSLIEELLPGRKILVHDIEVGQSCIVVSLSQPDNAQTKLEKQTGFGLFSRSRERMLDTHLYILPQETPMQVAIRSCSVQRWIQRRVKKNKLPEFNLELIEANPATVFAIASLIKNETKTFPLPGNRYMYRSFYQKSTWQYYLKAWSREKGFNED
jgi:hypothetical protein